MTVKGTLIKVADPKKGTSREEYLDICAALGLKPQPPKSPASDDSLPPADSTPPITNRKEVP